MKVAQGVSNSVQNQALSVHLWRVLYESRTRCIEFSSLSPGSTSVMVEDSTLRVFIVFFYRDVESITLDIM